MVVDDPCHVNMCFICLHAGKTLDRDFYFSPEEARQWGLIDEVIAKRPKETTITE